MSKQRHEWRELGMKMADITGHIGGNDFTIPGDKFYRCIMCGLVAVSGGQYFPTGECRYGRPKP